MWDYKFGGKGYKYGGKGYKYGGKGYKYAGNLLKWCFVIPYALAYKKHLIYTYWRVDKLLAVDILSHIHTAELIYIL